MIYKGKEIKISKQDEWLLNKHKWYYLRARSLKEKYYLLTTVGRKTIYLHRLILKTKSKKYVDHRNGDSLDFRRSNLRLVNKKQNRHNAALRSDSLTGYKGVQKKTGRETFQAYIAHNGIRIHLGNHKSVIEAAKQYDLAAKKYFGEYAKLNFPQ